MLAGTVEHVHVGLATADASDELRQQLVGRPEVDLAIVRYPTTVGWVPSALLGVQETHRIVPAGHIVYWGVDLAHPAGAIKMDRLEELGVGDTDECTASIREIFDGYANHYSVNPLLPEVDTASAYADWASRLLVDPQADVFVTRIEGGAIAGIAVNRRGGDLVEVHLAGVSPAFRGQGEYAALVALLLAHYGGMDIPRLVISTQDHNVGVQRQWARAGLLPLGAVATVHVMPRTGPRI